jgi:hypothetical protein
MKRSPFWHVPAVSGVLLFLAVLLVPSITLCEAAPPLAVSAFNSYCRDVEARLAGQHASAVGFLAPAAGDAGSLDGRLRRGEWIIEQLSPPTRADVSGALLHHWRGTAFAPGATAADFKRLMQDFPAYPQHFSPEVLQASVLMRSGDRMQIRMRVRQQHAITVVMDTTYDITFGQLDTHHGYSTSRSTRIAEIDSPGKSTERVLTPQEEHGFLWRLNTYWSYEERDGGLYLQIEAVSLTRSIPSGLGWLIRPYIESIPRESLEFTLRSVSSALRK